MNQTIKGVVAIVTMALGIVTVAWSDIYLRAGDRDGVNGIDAHSWDIVGSILLLVGVVMAIYVVFSKEALERMALFVGAACLVFFLVRIIFT